LSPTRSAATRAELFGIGTTLFTYPILQGTQNQPTSLCCLVTQIGLTFVAACQCGGEGRVVPPEFGTGCIDRGIRRGSGAGGRDFARPSAQPT
jgi:hypothetical protein